MYSACMPGTQGSQKKLSDSPNVLIKYALGLLFMSGKDRKKLSRFPLFILQGVHELIVVTH